jgi:hypothetical protein
MGKDSEQHTEARSWLLLHSHTALCRWEQGACLLLWDEWGAITLENLSALVFSDQVSKQDTG